LNRDSVARIQSIAEVESYIPPLFVFAKLPEASAKAMAEEKPWLKPHFVGPEGNLNMRVQSLVVDTGSMKIVVDTCTGNDKLRKTESWWVGE
jgi:hypothetical protein